MLTHTSHTGSLGCPCSRHRRNTLQQLHYSHAESLQDKHGYAASTKAYAIFMELLPMESMMLSIVCLRSDGPVQIMLIPTTCELVVEVS